MGIHSDLKINPITERLLDTLPALLSWGFMALIVILSLFNIIAVSFIIIAFTLIWLTKVAGYSYRLVRGYTRIRLMEYIDWQQRFTDLDNPAAALERLDLKLARKRLKLVRRSALRSYRKLLLQASTQKDILKPTKIYHAVIIATYNEAAEIVESTVRAVLNSDYDKQRVFLVIAYEERGGIAVERAAKELIKRYGEQFGCARAIKHPDGIAGEAIAKAGNITYAARWVAQYVQGRGIDPQHVMVTTLDADNRPDKNYLAQLSYIYTITPDRVKKSYQPVPMFFNNIWDVPAFMRVVATNSSFWQLMEAMRPHRLRNFSAHAQSLQTLIDTNYWNVKSLVEDGHQYWRTYFRYDGQHGVVPIFAAIYQDAVLADGYWATFKAQFYQLRRWAWGVSDTSYILVKCFRDRNISWGNKTTQILRHFEGYFSWATAPVVLAFSGWLPLLLNASASNTVLVHQLPRLSSRIQLIILFGLLPPIIASFMSLPKRPSHYGWWRIFMMLFQWITLPVSMIVFGSGAALNAQTRLFLNKPLEVFNVTEKKRYYDPETLETRE